MPKELKMYYMPQELENEVEIYVVDPDTNEVINEFENLQEYNKFYNTDINYRQVSKCFSAPVFNIFTIEGYYDNENGRYRTAPRALFTRHFLISEIFARRSYARYTRDSFSHVIARNVRDYIDTKEREEKIDEIVK